MTRDELLARLRRYEWTHIEFKQAQHDVPKDAYKTVSAFANTSGGWLVFGVREADGALDVVGVVAVDKVQNDFLSALRTGDKLNRAVSVAEDAHEVDGKTLLVFHVPESRRQDKPIYLGRDIRETYIRRGAGDERCTMAEIERFLRDADTGSTYDRELLDLNAEQVFDPDSLRWYRRVFEDRRPGTRQALTDMEFLREWGFVKERGASGQLAPTRAAVLVLGRGRYVRHVLSRPVVDCQFIHSTFNAWSPDVRWDDRIVVEENLVEAWLMLSERFVRYAEIPFRIDPATMRRDDLPPDYSSFREATINLLLHQDYGDQGRKPRIRFFRDRMEFWNPGDAFASTEQLLEPSEKDVRNPEIVAAFRRLGLSEQAGTGIRAIFRNWQSLGHVPPVIDNDKATKAFEVRFLRETLLTEEQQTLQSRLGLRLEDAEARVFAFACWKGRVSLVDAKAVTGFMGAQAAAVLETLHVQGVLERRQEGLYRLAEHIERHADQSPSLGQPTRDQVGDGPSDLATDQVTKSTAQVAHRPTDKPTAQGRKVASKLALPTGESEKTAAESMGSGSGPVVTQSTAQVTHRLTSEPTAQGHAGTQSAPPSPLSAVQRRIIAYCDVPRPLTEIMSHIGVTNRGHFKRKHLDPLIQNGLIAMTNPDQPRTPSQRYLLTEAGVNLQAFYMDAEKRDKPHGRS